MIGILQNKSLTPDEMSKIEKWHWSKVQLIIGKRKAKKLIALIEKKIIYPKKFENIVLADYNELCNLVSNNTTQLNRLNKFKLVKVKIKRLYEEYRRDYGKQLVKKLGLTVCPYCNRNFINNGEDYAIAQFDHFFSKSQYPVLALSLYNLIPCCAACNKLKGTNNFIISPYDKSKTTDKIIQFSFLPVNLNEYKVEVRHLVDDMKINIDVLQLSGLYSMHNDLIKQLICKQRQYNKIYLQYLSHYTSQSEADTNMSFKELYYGNYFSEDKYYLRPLSKFTKDIIEEIEYLETE